MNKKITKITASIILASMLMYSVPVAALTKDETVYSNLKSNGESYKTIVSTHLENIEDEKILNDFCIGIVGTRNATKYGEEITKSLAYGLAKHGVNIISGLARGIDTSAHTGTMLAKKRKNNCSFRKWFWKYLPKRKCRTY